MAKEEKDLETRFAELAATNAKLMAALEAKVDAPSGQFTPEVLREIMSGVAEAAAAPSNLLARKMKPENADHLHVSVFEHPKGGIEMPKPPLARELVFLGRIKEADLTYAEVLAVNELNASLGRSQRRLCRDGKWKAIVSDDNATLTISVPVKTIDDRQDLPAFIAIVQELTSGERPLDQADILSELAMLRTQVAQLQGAGA
jgi:hypothetical protein